MPNLKDHLANSRISNLLLVEDDATDLLILRRKIVKLLEPEIIDSAGDRRALSEALLSRRDLIVADLHLPDIEEAELLDAIAAAQPQTPCIILSGSVEHARQFAERPQVLDVIEKGDRAGLENCLKKYFDVGPA